MKKILELDIKEYKYGKVIFVIKNQVGGRGVIKYRGSNGWTLMSSSFPEIVFGENIFYCRGLDDSKDNKRLSCDLKVFSSIRKLIYEYNTKRCVC